MTRKAQTLVKIPAFIPVFGVDRAEYYDFLGQIVPRQLVEFDLKSGNYPPGLILQDHTGAYQVFGEQGKQQTVWPLIRMVKI